VFSNRESFDRAALPLFLYRWLSPLSVFMVTLNSIWCCGEIPLGFFSIFFGIVSVNRKGAWMVNLGIIFSLFSITLYVLMAVIPFFVVMSYPISPSDQPVPIQYNLFP
jgi:hypothetical protein